MDLVTGALGSLLPKLAKLLQDEYKLHKGVRRRIWFLTHELESLDAAVCMIPEDPTGRLDPSLESWASELKQLSYKMEYVVDTFLFRIEGSDPPNEDSSKRHVKKLIKLFQNFKNRREFSEQVKNITRGILQLRERQNRYAMIAATPSPAVTVRRRIDYRSQSELVGIDELTEDLVRSLTKEDLSHKQKIVSIVGFAGVGKTTLANAVFHKLQLEERFSCTAFVSVGQDPDLREVLTDMLGQFAKDMDNILATVRDACLEEVIDQLTEFLDDKRYFVVVDDIWDLKVWDLIKHAFSRNNKSLLLVTTRSVGIAKNIGRLYRLPPLSETYSRMLFYKRLFGSKDTCPPILADISEKFIAMCCGIPFAIIACSSFLATMTEKDWHAVHDPFLYENFDHGLVSMREILALSYTHLPPHLKSCLLYISMFPKDYDISGERLVWGWIAEGFIKEAAGTPLHELGERYLHELINRSLIEPGMVDAGGKVLSCRVHSLMHGLITSLSTGKEFSTTFSGTQRIDLIERINRLSIQGKYSMLQANLSDVRSLVVSGDANLMPSLSDFQQLRVLDLGSCDALQNDHLKGIDKSPLLKYVAIGGNCITRLPNEIVKLKLLQTLDLRESGLNELPEIVFWLTSLKRLYVNNHMKIPDGIGKMEALQELGDINICKPELLRELSNLDKLIVLRIAIWSWNERLVSSDEPVPVVRYLRSLAQGRKNIRSLSISTSCSLEFMDNLGAEWSPPILQKLEIMYSAFHTLPSWMDMDLLPTLSSLSVEVYKLSQQIIDRLESCVL